jgi:hypothetical protein
LEIRHQFYLNWLKPILGVTPLLLLFIQMLRRQGITVTAIATTLTNRCRYYNDKIQGLWFIFLWSPIFLLHVLDQFKVSYQQHVTEWMPTIVVMIISLLFTWGWSIATRQMVFLLAQTMTLFLVHHVNNLADAATTTNTKDEALLTITALWIFLYQAIYLWWELQATHRHHASFSHHSTDSLPCLPKPHVIAIAMPVLLFMIWTRAYVVPLLRWMIQALVVATALFAVVVAVQFGVLLGRIHGWWHLNKRHWINDRPHMATHMLSSVLTLTSMSSLLLCSLVRSDDNSEMRLAWCCVFVNAAANSAFIHVTDPPPHSDSPLLMNAKPFAKGYFASPSKPRQLLDGMILVTLATALLLPVITVMLTDTPSMQWWFQVQVGSYCLTRMTLLILAFVFYRKPLQWNLAIAEREVILSVEMVGLTQRYIGVVHANPYSKSMWRWHRSHITVSSLEGIVAVEYRGPSERLLNVRNSATLGLEMTPEDPKVFLNTVARAVKQAIIITEIADTTREENA